MFQSTNEAVFAVDFNPSDSTNIITCGKSHVYFWTLSAGQFMKKQGIFGVRHTWIYPVLHIFNFTLVPFIACVFYQITIGLPQFEAKTGSKEHEQWEQKTNMQILRINRSESDMYLLWQGIF